MSPPAGFYIYIIAERSSALWASAYAHTWSGPLPDASAEVLRSKCVEAEARMTGWRRAPAETGRLRCHCLACLMRSSHQVST